MIKKNAHKSQKVIKVNNTIILMKLDLNDLVEHVEKNSKRVTPLEHQFLGGLQGFAVGGTAFERDAFEEKNNHGYRTNSTHASFIGRIDSALNGNE